MNDGPSKPGSVTMNEILSQPLCWRECLHSLHAEGRLARLLKGLRTDGEWLFMGCGSSYYIALAAAASWCAVAGRPARAIPASELLLFPDLALAGSGPIQPVLISRSGRTSEVLRAARYLERERGIPALAVSCAAAQPLEDLCSATLHLLPADEKSMVMTRSFTSMLLGLQLLAGAVAGNEGFTRALLALPEPAQAALDRMVPLLELLAGARSITDYVFLAQGPLFGVAMEWHLKVKEMSSSSALAYHSLEFRHGPKAALGPGTLAGFLLSESGFDAECEMLEEVKELGATTLVVTERADRRLRENADLLFELNLGVPEYARTAAYAFAGQLLGYFTGLNKGLDPDSPRNLTRVVILDDAP